MAPDHLRPLRATEIVDMGFALGRRTFTSSLPLLVAVLVPIEFLVWLAQYSIVRDRDPFGLTETEFGIGEIVSFITRLGILPATLQIIGLVIAVAVAVPGCVDAFAGNRPLALRSALQRTARKLPSSLVVLVVAGLCVIPVGGALTAASAFVAFGIIFMASFVAGFAVVLAYATLLSPLAFMVAVFAPCLPAQFAEEIGPGRALSRGFQLGTRRAFNYTAVMLLVLGIITIAWVSLQLIVSGIAASETFASPAFESGLSVFFGALVSLLVAPPIAGILSAIYFEARVRREGLDLAWELAQ